MELKDAIITRRSYTKYLDKKVDLKLIADILNTAIYAPSSGNMQNWYIVLVDDDDKREKIANASLKQLWMLQAPIHIVICDKKQDMKRMYGKKADEFGLQNCAALAQNILLLATEAGLASCWVGSFDKEAVSRVIGASPNEEPQIIITLGYSNDNPKSTRHELDKVCCFNNCGARIKGFDLFPLEKYTTKMEKKMKKESKSLFERIKKLFRRSEN